MYKLSCFIQIYFTSIIHEAVESDVTFERAVQSEVIANARAREGGRVENMGREKMLGVGTPFFESETDLVPREWEVWDTDLCWQMREEGDPSLGAEFKEEVFRQFVRSIDRNGSLAAWQKNYAFSLLPKAFGGPEGEYIEAILAKMRPKQEQVKYELKAYGQGAKGAKEDKAVPSREADVAGLGL